MAFFAQVSDPSLGGTYMTFFNTVANLGNKVSCISETLNARRPVIAIHFVPLTRDAFTHQI